MKKTIRIGLIGTGFMGKAHAVAFQNVPLVFGSEPVVPEFEMIADIDEQAAQAFSKDFGFSRWVEVIVLKFNE